MKLPEDFKKKWIAALRSGEYKQGIRFLLKGDYYCCLGVACVISGNSLKSHSLHSSQFIKKHHKGIPEQLRDIKIQRQLAAMNDLGSSFNEIADYIEANL